MPYAAIVPDKVNEYQGVELTTTAPAGAAPAAVADAGADAGVDAESTLPLAWVMSKNHVAYLPNKAGKLRPSKKPGYHYRFHVVGTAQQGETTFLVAPDGQHFRTRDVTRVDAREKPAEVADDEKWLDVDLERQSLVAYVGSRPVYATLVSTGRIKDELDPLKNFETPGGMFRITSKHLSATMDGDHALDGPYSIEDVPYVMYFQLAYALHSAFWHNGFGRPRSHGCINLAPADARYVFNFVEPKLPPLWHGVYPLPDTFGTRLYIHGKTPEG
jgi:lipoprotein-anchoring transpeptidase ErfK/SrfK